VPRQNQGINTESELLKTGQSPVSAYSTRAYVSQAAMPCRAAGTGMDAGESGLSGRVVNENGPCQIKRVSLHDAVAARMGPKSFGQSHRGRLPRGQLKSLDFQECTHRKRTRSSFYPNSWVILATSRLKRTGCWRGTLFAWKTTTEGPARTTICHC